MCVPVVPLQVPELRHEPPLDGPEPRLARLGDGAAHALGAASKRPGHDGGPSGAGPVWRGPAAIMMSLPSLDVT